MATQVTLNSGAVSSAGSLKLQTNGTTDAVTIDTAQNVGVGVTPSAWNAGPVVQIGSGANYLYGGSSNAIVGTNSYYNSGWKFGTSAGNYAVQYQQVATSGQHQWFISTTTGTTGNAATLTQAMTLDASGNLTVVGDYLLNSSNPQIACASGAMRFVTGGLVSGGGTERARIDTSGNLLVGTTTASAKVTVYANSGTVGQYIQVYQIAPTIMQFANSQGNGGSITMVSGGGTAYNTSSDYRLKHDIQPMTGALAKVSALKPCTYKWNVDDSEGEGFIAHELAEVVPQAVHGIKDGVDEEGNPKYQGIDTSFLVATLTAAIQEQQAIIEQLKADVAALKG